MIPVSGYLRSAFLWAMIPLIVFASRPVTGCTCASGEYKIFCAAHLNHGKAKGGLESAGFDCDNACRWQSNGTKFACCQREHCPLSDGHGTLAGYKCCNPDALAAVAVTPPVTFSVDIDRHTHFDSPIVETGNLFAGASVARYISCDTGPPGGNLVISLRRLLV